MGELTGKGEDSRLLAIRTDMDALPIQERTKLEFASHCPGVMHACGHDIHTTVGLGDGDGFISIIGKIAW